jgi:hypothetical protein
MSGQYVMNYFNIPNTPGVQGTAGVNGLPTGPQAWQASPAFPGQQPVATWDTWVPQETTDPYVAGMRTSASALAAITGVSKMAVGARFEVAKALKLGGARVSSSAARFAGRSTSAARLPKGMQAAKTFAQKSQYTQSVRAGVGSAFRHTFLSIGNVARALGGAAIVAVPIALVTNFLDHQAGKITEQQRNALILADTAGYTVTGATATLVGGAIGSTFLGPVIGTVVGVGAGFALGWVYEKFIRPQWGRMVQSAIYEVPAPSPVTDPYLPK